MGIISLFSISPHLHLALKWIFLRLICNLMVNRASHRLQSNHIPTCLILFLSDCGFNKNITTSEPAGNCISIILEPVFTLIIALKILWGCAIVWTLSKEETEHCYGTIKLLYVDWRHVYIYTIQFCSQCVLSHLQNWCGKSDHNPSSKCFECI